jgi:hypothetical protein
MRQPDKPFSQLYHDALRDKTVSAEARFLAVLFATYVGPAGLTYPRTPRLMELTGWDRDKVNRARAEAAKAGYLVRMRIRDAGGRFQRKHESRLQPAVKWRVSEKLLRPNSHKGP